MGRGGCGKDKPVLFCSKTVAPAKKISVPEPPQFGRILCVNNSDENDVERASRLDACLHGFSEEQLRKYFRTGQHGTNSQNRLYRHGKLVLETEESGTVLGQQPARTSWKVVATLE
ncbi:hypothetical protein BaRGS_00016494 [Batillaria attramentaria]|uniref:Uncharacterized protein n=1 Tax=Batillaria attramentaria TaxID=370345 RepID=A0ABD0KY98_9CAEN